MEEKLMMNDFIELEYTGKVKNNGIFDTNIEEEAKKINLDIKTNPLIMCLGQNMILPAIDKFLINKNVGKYTLELKPEEAFGLRNKELIKTMPLSVFNKQDIIPRAGMMFSFDSMLGKITAVSGGRVIVDFNNPLAGKDVIYELKIKRKIEEEKEKVKALMLFFFRKEFDFSIENKKLIIKAEKNTSKFLSLFKEKFKEILNLELEASESKDSNSDRNSEEFRHTQKSAISDIKEKEEKMPEEKKAD